MNYLFIGGAAIITIIAASLITEAGYAKNLDYQFYKLGKLKTQLVNNELIVLIPFTFMIENTNNVNLHVRKVFVEIFHNGSVIAVIDTANLTNELKANENTPLELQANVISSSFIKNIPIAALERDFVISMRGTMQVYSKTAGEYLKMPISETRIDILSYVKDFAKSKIEDLINLVK